MSWFQQQLATQAPSAEPTGAAGAYRDPFDQQIAEAVRAGYPAGVPVNEDFVNQQVEEFRRYRAGGNDSGLVTSGQMSPDDYWVMRAGMAAQDEPASGVPGAGTRPSTMASGGGGGLPQGYSLTGANNLASFSAPGLAAPYTQPFQRPDPNTIRDDPSYQFQLQEGNDALQRSAAAKGTLLTGSTLKDIAAWSQGLASTFDDKYWDRAFKIDNRDAGIYYQNQDNAFSRLGSLANAGQNAASSYAANVGNAYGAGGNAAAQNTLNQAQSWNNTFGDLAEAGAGMAQDWLNRRNRGQGGTLPQLPTQPGIPSGLPTATLTPPPGVRY